MSQPLLSNDQIIEVINKWAEKESKSLTYHQFTRLRRYLELREIRKVNKTYVPDHDVFYENAYDLKGQISNWRYLPKEHPFWDQNRHINLSERKTREYPQMPLDTEKPSVIEEYLRKIGL